MSHTKLATFPTVAFAMAHAPEGVQKLVSSPRYEVRTYSAHVDPKKFSGELYDTWLGHKVVQLADYDTVREVEVRGLTTYKSLGLHNDVRVR